LNKKCYLAVEQRMLYGIFLRSLIRCLPLAALLGSAILTAQESMVIPKLPSEPVLDGNLFEPVWDQLEAIELVTCLPNAGDPPSQPSSFKIGYTEKYLFFAVFNYDSEPDKIQSSSKIRDEMELNNDWCGLSLDVYHDGENALNFSTSPAALRLDMQIINDGEGDFPLNSDWNTLWEVETQTTDEGWFAEFRIPLSSLRYQVTDNKVKMGLSVFRYINRYSEWQTFPEISDQWGFWSWTKVSRFREAEMRDVQAVNPLYFSPYLLGGVQQACEMNEEGTAYPKETTWKGSAGIDVKYGLAKNLTLDLTVNTDFAQVEADDQKINLTRYSLFFPEKRQFFMERANVFDFSFGEEGQFFYSRTIGLYEGQQVPIWGGGRITGRAGKWDLGAMSLQTGSLKDGDREQILGSENHAVVRMRRQLPLNKNSYVGFMGNSKIDGSGLEYAGAGLDAILNLKGNTYLKLAWAQTVDSSNQGMCSLDQSRQLLLLQRRVYDGFSYDLGYERAGSEYNPEMGFEFRSDFTKLSHNLRYGFIPPAGTRLARQQFMVKGNYYFNNADGTLETVEVIPLYTFTTRKSAELTVHPLCTFDHVRDSFDLSDEITIQPGRYQNAGLSFNYMTSFVKMYYTGIEIYSGSYYGGWRNSFTLSPVLNINNSWRFNITYSFNRIDFSQTDQVYLAHLIQFKLTYMYSTKLSASSYIQYNSLTGSFYINARIRYNPREGNDLYLVYNDAMNSNRYVYDPVLPVSDLRALLIKYTHSFRIR
jgi:hypothetical protein